MSKVLRQIITELRQGAEMSVEGAGAVQWRQRIIKLASPSITAHGAGLFIIASSARNLLLQRGQISAESDVALCGVLVELANVLEMELTGQEARQKPRSVARREQLYYLKDGG